MKRRFTNASCNTLTHHICMAATPTLTPGLPELIGIHMSTFKSVFLRVISRQDVDKRKTSIWGLICLKKILLVLPKSNLPSITET